MIAIKKLIRRNEKKTREDFNEEQNVKLSQNSSSNDKHSSPSSNRTVEKLFLPITFVQARNQELDARIHENGKFFEV
jgi:hypothetical protein